MADGPKPPTAGELRQKQEEHASKAKAEEEQRRREVIEQQRRMYDAQSQKAAADIKANWGRWAQEAIKHPGVEFVVLATVLDYGQDFLKGVIEEVVSLGYKASIVSGLVAIDAATGNPLRSVLVADMKDGVVLHKTTRGWRPADAPKVGGVGHHQWLIVHW